MTQEYKDEGERGVGEVWALIGDAFRSGASASVPADSLPLLARVAGCHPEVRGDGERVFVFRPVFGHDRCAGWERGLALALGVLGLPVFVIVGVLVFLFDGRPVLFRQERFGVGGKAFSLIKFRTMMRHSERVQAHMQRHLGQKGRLFKLRNDPRVTRLGCFLRRTFLDEAPQLWNVVRGEMRLVGPRPLPVGDLEHYTRPEEYLRLNGVPGLTGLWQVSGRNDRTFEEMCLLDIYYLGNRSWRFDLWIVWRTVRLLLQQIGL